MTLISELSDPSDVLTLLNSGWNASIIAKPTMKEGFFGDLQTDGNTILVGWNQLSFDSTDLGIQNDEVDNFFEIVIFSDHKVEATAKTNLIKLLSETRRIVNRTITNGQWHLDSVLPHKRGHEQLMICTLREHFHYLGD